MPTQRVDCKIYGQPAKLKTLKIIFSKMYKLISDDKAQLRSS